MNLQELTFRVRTAVGEESGLKAKVKFNFGAEGFIFIDGLAKPNQVSNEDDESDITITLSMENFQKIIDKKLSPQMALMTGRMRLKGDMRIALRLNPVFGIE